VLDSCEFNTVIESCHGCVDVFSLLLIVLRHVLLYVIVIVRIITSISVAKDLEFHSIDIEQSFFQTDKLMEGVNDRYFINPSPGTPGLTTRILCMK
jgi:hypothetical protein